MSRILYENRCKCITKKRKSISRSEKLLPYPKETENEIRSKTFQIKYEKKLSSTAKCILNSFKNKYIYFAIDDLLDSFQLKSLEGEDVLAILYSPILSLQNNFCVNFFDIWILDIYIDEISKVNKFLQTESQTSEQFTYITMKLFYKISLPVKKRESLW